ncbi:unnamed protein product [Peronospora farinosa]|uniref:Uncharacterized protein n=1 Tax=Peronospora farinosa TaxID=134698 RepID=A0AAV0TNE1_9STRA|nr:unnamed protein product [Peronospora farinosa]CAI5724845.1 unnamed protein product [Peronospora farinosa]
MKLASITRGDDENKQKKNIQDLMERVQQFQEEQQRLIDEDSNEEALMERMQELALLDQAGKLTLESLTAEERKRFLREVADGRLGKLVGLWTPWWFMSERKYCSETTARRRQFILEEIEDDGYENEELIMVEPAVLYPVGLFTNSEAQNMPDGIIALLPGGRLPSPCLRFNLIEVLFAYTLVLRAFNGDYGQDVAEAALMLLDLCQVLSLDARYGSVEHVCVTCLEKRSSDGPAANALAIQDTQQLLRSDVFLLDALSDTHALLKKYAQELARSGETDKQARKEKKAAMKKLTVVQKKLEFYKTWAYRTPIDEFRALVAEIEAYVNDKKLLGAKG